MADMIGASPFVRDEDNEVALTAKVSSAGAVTVLGNGQDLGVVTATAATSGGFTYQVGGQTVEMGGSLNAKTLNKPAIKICWIGNSVIYNGATWRRIEQLSGGRFVTSLNSGVSGAGTVYLTANIATLLDPTCDLVVLMEGSNDATSAVTCGQHYTNMKTMVEYCQAQGKVVMVLASPPRDLSGTDTHKRTQKYPATDWLVAKDTGSMYCDPWRDFRTVAGEWPAGYTTSGDNTHPGFGDIYEAATLRIYNALLAAVEGGRPQLEPTSDDESAGYSSVSNLGGTGLAKGNALLQDGTANWTLVDTSVSNTSVTDANVVLSTASAAPFRGNELVIDFTAGISATRTLRRRFLTNVSTNKPALNDEILCTAVVSATGLSNAKVRVFAYAVGLWADKSICPTRRLDFSREYLDSGIFTVTSATAAAEYSIWAEITQINTGAPAYGTLTISNCEMYNLTKLRATNYGV